MLSLQIKEFARRSVLCWLATVDESGQPNVSPKEIFAVLDSDHLVIANIASAGSARNIERNALVCVAFIDVFVQKGFKVTGAALNVRKTDPDFFRWATQLVEKAGPRFAIQSVFVVKAGAVEEILAPSYRIYPTETTEESQAASAMQAYGVRPVRSDA